jgi:hypothetical protein|tara:strand:+ start:243 stop:443 length:201 start_codon:yes stop_codon:yes gene_type:complete
MDLDDRVREIEVEMASHEAQCEERWKTTFNRLNDIDEHLQRIENRILAGGGATLLFLMGLVASHML